MMKVYELQKVYFEEAYRTGEHGWPVTEPERFVMDFLKKNKRSLAGKRLLDIGSGEGRHTIAAAMEGLVAYGMDYQFLAVKRAIGFSKGKDIKGSLHFIAGDIFNIPFKDGAFDVLIDYGVLHHIKKPDAMDYINRLPLLLKERGYFILSCFSNRFKHYEGERRKRDWTAHRGHYDRFFKKKDLYEIFADTFEIIDVAEEINGLHAFYHILMRKR
ncbi:MAG: class I SAM-dependent methyltransferase [Nitrospirae bacterium]|nr:class I SAM-dependent methyltransferase [Nitrospirota bacterium]